MNTIVSQSIEIVESVVFVVMLYMYTEVQSKESLNQPLF